MSKIELAKSLFNAGNSSTLSNSNYVLAGETSLDSSNVRYGTVISDDGDNYYTVQLAGSDELIKVYSDTPLTVGQGVQLIIQNGKYVVAGLSNFVNETRKTQKTLAKQIEEQGEKITASVSADIQTVQDDLDAFKETHVMTDEEINEAIAAGGDNSELANRVTECETKITQTQTDIQTEATARVEAVSGAINECKTYTDESATGIAATVEKNVNTTLESYATKSDLEATSTSITTSVAETYQKQEDAATEYSELESKITQTSDAITQEVSDRKEAVTGAVSESKAYTDQQAASISSTVESNVKDSLGDTYATKTELQQTSDNLSIDISAAVSTANSASSTASSASSTASSAKSTANSASSTASTALSTANTANTFINTHFDYSTSGLEISSSSSNTSLLLGADKIEFDKGSTSAFLIGVDNSDYVKLYTGSSYDGLRIQGWGDACFTVYNNYCEFSGAANTSAGMVREDPYNASYDMAYRGGRSLYSGSSNGTITLTGTASNYDFIQIFYHDKENKCSSVIVEGSKTSVVLQTAGYWNSTGCAVNAKAITISGKTITQNTGIRMYVATGGGTASCATQTDMYITAVYGWRH